MDAKAQRLVCFVAAAILAGVGAVLILQVKEALEDRRREDFRVEAAQVTTEIDIMMTQLSDRLRAIGAYLVTSRQVTESEFALFVATTDLFAENDIQAVGLIPRIAADRVPLLNQVLRERAWFRRGLGYPDVEVAVPRDRAFAFPVIYAESPYGREGIVGQDLAGSPERMNAIDRAIETENAHLSAPIRLSQDIGGEAPGMLLVTAVTYGNLGLGPEVRGRERLVVVAIGFTPQRGIQQIMGRSRSERFGITIRDVTDGTPQPVAAIEIDGPSDTFVSDTFVSEQALDVAGRRWAITYTAGVGFMAGLGTWWLYLIGGVSLVLLVALTFALDQLIRRREILARSVEERTAQLTVMNEQLAATAAKAHAASDAKSEFLAHMSHELRTPLNALLGFSDMLASEVHGALGHRKYAEYARDMQLAGNHLLALINDILDLARVEAGATEIEEDGGGIALDALLRECVRMTSAQAQSRVIRVSVNCRPDLPRLMADERLIRQVILNLLSNAIKYNRPQGMVRLEARLAKTGGLVIRVEDDGIGIAAEDIDRVLEPFGQARSSHQAGNGGTGLGLALARRFVELHGGSLALDSRAGEGTTVTLRFPPGRTGRPATEDTPAATAG